jgi:hypothetical protein
VVQQPNKILSGHEFLLCTIKAPSNEKLSVGIFKPGLWKNNFWWVFLKNIFYFVQSITTVGLVSRFTEKKINTFWAQKGRNRIFR